MPKHPKVIDIEPGTYAWCSCGKSAELPFCDGAHSGTGKRPHIFMCEEGGKKVLCNCAQSSNPPFCDGSHPKG